jgi:O-antigen/teichoic acid export membrane protein
VTLGPHNLKSAHRTELLKGSTGTLLLRFAYVGIGASIAVVLARTLGPTGYGIYVYAYAIITLLATPVRFGLPALVVRETARLEAQEDWARVRGLWRWANQTVALISLAVSIAAAFVVWLLATRITHVTTDTLLFGLALIPLIALGSIRGASLIGLRKVVQGQLPEEILRPTLLILGVLAFVWVSAKRPTPIDAMLVHVLAAAIAFGVGAWMLAKSLPHAMRAVTDRTYERRRWLLSVLPFAAMEGLFLINNQMDVVLLGALSTARDVGIYRVASQGAMFVGLGFQALGIALMPHFTRTFALGDTRRFRMLSSVGVVGGVALGAPFFIGFVLFGHQILGFVFGQAYASGYVALVILSLAQLANVASGMSGRVLNAAGHERVTLIGILIGAVCNIAFNLVLIPKFGLNGAAIGTGLSMIAWNIMLWSLAKRRLRIDSSLLSILRADNRQTLKLVMRGRV